MFILLVSDIHLCNQRPYVIEGFLKFLYCYAINAKALYILGDLFETWIGDDDPNPLHKRIADALRYLNQHKTKCYFIHGNRDFLLGKQYAISCEMTLLPNQKILRLYGHRIILLHGDILCMNDENYQIFRKYIRKIWIQKIFLSLPISIRLYIKDIIKNKKIKKYNSILSFKINQKKITRILYQTNTEIMIHGHIHQEKMYYKTIDNILKLERIVLGEWKNTGSVIKINKWKIRLKKFFF